MTEKEGGRHVEPHVTIHLERLPTGEPSWWAESRDISGLSAAAGTLTELRELVVAALNDVATEEGWAVESIDWHFEGEIAVGASATPEPVNPSRGSSEGPAERVEQVQRVLVGAEG